ncbi:MAG TPA: HAMP domain-containing sensor histidine kinase [Actinophytocola sp.]|uniref:sensor histidine kinase n=1 Tax=Actinophytocola sp. TaxID=1872138 RepID=UPI002DBB09F6|nr:HAMP domain-containing sensor histidine kinase [Actinophytocola sp.]HEU5475450.1 HAMP domain-containing sensor histidine kinase [Actinophytocola sp.]
MFSGLFLLAGLALLMINYVVVNETLPDGAGVARSIVEGVPPDPRVNPPPKMDSVIVSTVAQTYRASTMRQLVLASGIALIGAAAIAALLGWLTARHALRPLHTITATARRLEAESLDRRINLEGPDDELKELADTFDRMLDRLAASFDGQKRFVANASHELRTPLAVQRTLIEVAMADPTASPELLRLGQHLLHTNERSERLIEGLLVLARSDQGLVSRLPVRLDEVTDTVLRSAGGMAAEQGVAVASRLEPRTVVGDHVLLERLVTNLVHNALHYNEPGGSVVVEVTAEPALTVTNTGPVVSADALPGLFEPFRRLDRTRAAGRDGAGLGLSIVRSIVKAHNGVVYAEPNLGGGLRITVHLPGINRVPSFDQAPAETLRV